MRLVYNATGQSYIEQTEEYPKPVLISHVAWQDKTGKEWGVSMASSPDFDPGIRSFGSNS